MAEGVLTFGFIGCGNMGGAVARAVRRAMPEARLLLSNRTPLKARQLAEELNGEAVGNRQAAQASDFLFLGVKPQMMAGVLAELGDVLKARAGACVPVTMAAGLTIEAIRRLADFDGPVIRIMPNTPAAVGRGNSAVLDSFLTFAIRV